MSAARAVDLGIRIGTMTPGPMNAITDVPGVGVGHRTVIEGDDVRTGVTVVMPRDGAVAADPVFAAPHRLNGNGEMTGLEWIRESGLLTSPIGLTNTHSVGTVHSVLVEHGIRVHPEQPWALPVVAETWDGRLNDINGFHVRPEHVWDAIDAVSRGPVEEGSVGGGTGMVSFGFKSGIGTASRYAGEHIVGVLVQSNFGRRDRFTVEGVPVGRFLGPDLVPLPAAPQSDDEQGSIIVIGATNAPLLPHQCARVAQRIALGIGRLGGLGGNSSGDLFLFFATGNHGADGLSMVPNDGLDDIFGAVVEATEEAVLNSMLASSTMTGRDGVTVHALPHDSVVEVLRRGWSPLV